MPGGLGPRQHRRVLHRSSPASAGRWPRTSGCCPTTPPACAAWASAESRAAADAGPPPAADGCRPPCRRQPVLGGPLRRARRGHRPAAAGRRRPRRGPRAAPRHPGRHAPWRSWCRPPRPSPACSPVRGPGTGRPPARHGGRRRPRRAPWRYACHRLVLAAESVRDQLSQDIWHILSPPRPDPRAPAAPGGLAAAPPARQRARVAAGRRGRRAREHGPRPDVGLPRRRHPGRAGPAHPGAAAGDAHLRAPAGHRRAGHRGGARGQREHHHPPPPHDVRRGTRLAVALGHFAAPARRRQPAVGRVPGRPASAMPSGWPATRPSWTAAARWPPSLGTLDLDELCAGDRAALRDALDTVGRALRDLVRRAGRRATSAASRRAGAARPVGRRGADEPSGSRRLHASPLRGAAPDDVHLRGCRRHRLLRARLPRAAPDTDPAGARQRGPRLPGARPGQRAHRPLRQPVVVRRGADPAPGAGGDQDQRAGRRLARGRPRRAGRVDRGRGRRRAGRGRRPGGARVVPAAVAARRGRRRRARLRPARPRPRGPARARRSSG